MHYIRFFDELGIDDIGLVGGKNASLGEMITQLGASGVKVPFGFASTSTAYRDFIEQNGLKEPIKEQLDHLNIEDIHSLQKCGSAIRKIILSTPLHEALKDELKEAYRELSRYYKCEMVDVAVRSSATAEDLPEASFAGQQESYLNVSGVEALYESVHHCIASLFTNRAISYRASRGYDHFSVALCVGVQKMVRSDKASSGVMFTIDTESGSPELIMINSIWGLGENIVGGTVTPDEFYLFKPTLKKGHHAILKHQIGSKKMKMIYSQEEGNRVLNIPTSQEEQEAFSLSDDELLVLGEYGLKIEEHYSQKAGLQRPMDIEWAKDGSSGELFIIQARPETVQSQNSQNEQEIYSLVEQTLAPKVLIRGRAVGEKIGSGAVKIIPTIKDIGTFKAGDVLVTDITDPDWEPVMKIASAVITNSGGRTCHAAIVAREIGVPAIVGAVNATTLLVDNQEVTVSCAQGEDGFVYEGKLEYQVERLDFSHLKAPKTKLFMNVGNPEKAFSFAKLPNEGVGLARMEFIINNAIKAHPMALYHLYQGDEVQGSDEILQITKGFSNPKTFFVNQLAEGIAMIAAAFYPKPVIVRTSDFKSNEYKHMLGGAAYERDEENPMIGFRGAGRYLAPEYRAAFLWECEALKKVRDEMGLNNVKIMLPFTRTVQEGKAVIEIMNSQGLVQGENDLEIYAMCEIPANVILADQFLEVFDGYSIGSNDLTQLTLGVDRDSVLVASTFDERNLAVTRMIKMAIEAAKKADKYIGICGQAPSDYPEITEFLVEHGIDSISLNPDSLFKMWQVVSDLEEKLGQRK
jgi:pyruvate, water dikinase